MYAHELKVAHIIINDKGEACKKKRSKLQTFYPCWTEAKV